MNRLIRVSSRGFTLIELLVALSLGVLLSFGLVQVLQNTRLLANTETSLSRVQEVGRYSMDIISSDLRKSGFHGRSDPGNVEIKALMPLAADPNTSSLLGYSVNNSGVFAPALSATSSQRNIQTGTATGAVVARPNSDVLYMQFATTTAGLQNIEAKSELFCKDPTTAPNTLDVGLKNGEVATDEHPICFKQNQPIVISNGSRTLIFKNTATDSCIDDSNSELTLEFTQSDWDLVCTTTNNVLPIGKGVGGGAGASVLLGENLEGGISYFVGDTGRDTQLGDSVYALYRMTGDDAPQELVEGVEFMRVEYGEEISAGNVKYVDASGVGDFANVKSVKVGLLVQGLDRSLTEADDRSYRLLNVTIPASGNGAHSGGFYLRKPFATTVKLRNRSVGS